ncbi:MAG: DUF1292 domain-containing protein [Bacilli bacterium]|nr:DUF1292 domain-containing protein [Bacilli bacterium]
MKEEKRMITIKNNNGENMEAELITYLISEDNQTSYMVYSKGEKVGAEDDEIFYITRIVKNGNMVEMYPIENDDEWQNVQKLLKRIANA